MDDITKARNIRGIQNGRAHAGVWALGAGLAVLLIGASGMLGWLTGSDMLKAIAPQWATMKANTALCFVLAGASLCLLTAPKRIGDAVSWRQLYAAGCGVAVALYGFLTLLEYGFDLNFGIDLLLFKQAALLEANSHPGRMSPVTAWNFLLAGTALALLGRRVCHAVAVSQYLAFAVVLDTLPAALGYAFDVAEMYTLPGYGSIALHTTLGFLLLSFGLLAANPRHGLIALFAAQGSEGIAARNLLAGALSIPPAIGWVSLAMNRLGWYGPETRLALNIEADMLVFVALVAFSSQRLVRANHNILRANRLYAVLSRINQTIAQVRQPATLCEEICRIAVALGQFNQAWIGLDDGDGTFRLVALAGPAMEDEVRLPGKPGQAPEIKDGLLRRLRQDTPLICNDVQQDPELDDLRAELGTADCRALAAFPIHIGEGMRGIFAVHSNETAFFDADEIRLLREISQDIGFALEQIQQAQDRENAEVALVESEERFRVLVEGVKDFAIFLLDTQGNVVTWNPGAERITGYREEEILGRHFSCFYGEQDRYALKPEQELEETAKQGRVEAQGWRVRCNGTTFWADTVITALRDQAGSLTGYAKITRDITEKRQADEEIRVLNAELERLLAERTARLAESEEFSRAIIETTSDGVIVIDEQGLVQRFNPGAERMFGYSADEVRGQNVRMLMPAPYRDEHDGYLAHYLETGEQKIIGKYREVPGLRRDRSTLPVLLGIAEIWQGKQRLFAGILRDITELKRTEERLAAANKELESFSYSVSHDLRAPLRAIDGFSRILEEDASDKLDAENLRVVAVIRDSTRKMGRLIDDLLSFSRLGRKELLMAPVDMTGLAQSICEELKNTQPERRLRFDLEAMAATIGDGALLRQVWFNLLSNAVKYTKGRGPAIIHIGSFRQAGETVYFVRDNGAGFDMRYAGKLFGVFQRLHSGEDFEGTGVGLAIVQRVVTRHGGRVWAEGKVDAGAVFYFAMPEGDGHGSERAG